MIAGIGFRRACAPEEIVALVRRALGEAGLAPDRLAGLATLAARAEEAPLRAAAAQLGVPVLPVRPAALAAADGHGPTRSAHSVATHGVGSVAEAAALAAAGARVLALPRIAAASATCALARRPAP